MYDHEYEYTEIQKKHQENIISKLNKFTSNEISYFNSPFPSFFDLNDTLINQKSEFTKHFLDHSPCFNPKYFSDKIEQKFSRIYNNQNKTTMTKILQNQLEHIKWKNNVVYARINKPETYPFFSKYYPLYLDSISKFTENHILAIQSLQSETPNYNHIESIIKYDYYHRFCNFQINNLLYVFKKFSLIRRTAILSIVKETLVEDLIFDINPSSIPTIITESDALIDELKRFSSFLNIEFDIDSQDGQHFSYSCEKLFFTTTNQTILFELTSDSLPPIEYPTYLDLLNDNFIKNTKIDEKISFSFDNLTKPSEEGIDQILKKFNNALIKELTKDKVTSLIRLQFCKNRIILKSIIESIQSIEKVARKILKEDLNNFFNEHFTIFRKITLVVASSVKSNSPQKYSIDDDSLLEIVLDLYDQFYKCKVKILNVLHEINVNSQNIDLSLITKKFIEFRPDLISGVHKLCIQPFQLSVKILKEIGSALQTLINLQIYTQKEFCSLYGKHFPWFEFAVVDTKYQHTNDSFPFSPFEISPFIEKVADFLLVSRDVVLEITESFCVRSTRYKPYFEYAIWTQLLNEMGGFITNLTPESFSFNMKVSEKVSSLMTTPYLNDLDFIMKVINDFKGKGKPKFLLNYRNMILLGWKLQSFLIKSDFCMKVYHEQLSELEKRDDQHILDFAYGDYEFAVISDDWASDELEKIAKAQHCYQVALEVAVRFNNYRYDSSIIQKVLEMNQFENPPPTHKPKAIQVNRYKVIKTLPSLLFYEPDLIDEKLYSSFFCYITALKDFSDTNRLVDFYLPYSIRSEIAFICILERCCLNSYLSYEVFHTSSNPKETFFNSANKLDHFFVPTTPQALFLDKSKETLNKVLQFISIRYQLLKYSQHESLISRIKNSDLEETYHEKLLWTTNLFARIKYEISDFLQCNDIDFSIDYFNKERETLCSMNLLVALSVLDLSVKPKIEVKKSRRNEEEIETYSFESVKSYLIDINRPITGSSSFMSSSLYAQSYLDQFWYQCNDTLRTEFSHQQSQVEKQISDSTIAAKKDEYLEVTHKFSVDSMHLSLMRLGLFYLDSVKDPQKVTIDSIIKSINKEMILNGMEKFDNENQVQATYKARTSYKPGTMEMNYLNAKIKVMKEELEKHFEQYQFQIFMDQYKKEEELVESAFYKQTSLLKPECYSERISMKSSQRIFIPPIPSLTNQFTDEMNYAKLFFVRMLCNSVLKNRTIEDDLISINSNDFKVSIKDLSSMLSVFFNTSRLRLVKTWKGYIKNMLYNLKQSTDSQESINIYVCYFINKFKCSVYYDLSKKLKENYVKFAHLRDRENRINQEQQQFEEQEERKIRKEFELLVRDLNEEIRKAKLRFVSAKNKFYEASFNAINKVKDDPNYIEKMLHKSASKENLDQTEIKNTLDNKSEDKRNDEKTLLSDTNLENNDKLSDSTEIEVETSESEIKEIDSSKEPKISFSTEMKETEESKKQQDKLFLTESDDSNSKESTQSNKVADNETELNIDPFPSFTVTQNTDHDTLNEIIINSPKRQDTIMLTSSDKTAIMSNLADEKNDENHQILHEPKIIENKNQQQTFKQDEDQETHKTNENMLIPTPPIGENINKSRNLKLIKSSSDNPKISTNLSMPTENILLNGRRSINLRKLQAKKIKTKQVDAKTDLNDPSNLNLEIADSSSLSSSIFASCLQERPEKKNTKNPKQVSETFEMFLDVTDRIESTKKSIEELQDLCKKLRVSTTVSAIAVKRIYTRMISKVAEEKKSYSATLWHGRRVLEEDLKEQNDELKEAYNKLNSTESEIESLQEEIAKTKEANIKLLHWKELNIRQVDLIHKELRKLNVNTDVNISTLLKKISKKQEELEVLLLEQQNFEEELYYTVREPMMQSDALKRTLKIRRAQDAAENFFRQQQNQLIEEIEAKFDKNADEISQKEKSEKKTKKLVREFKNGSFLNSLKWRPPVNISDLPISEQINMRTINLREQNEKLKQENDDLRNRIKEMEKQIPKPPPKSKKKGSSKRRQTKSKSTRTKSHKPLIKPSSTKKGLKPGSSRNHM